MNSHCTHLTLPTIEYYLTCKTCPSSFHYSCFHLSSIISISWTHLNNPIPAYAIAIFNLPNFSFSCPNCISIKPLTSPHKLLTSNKNTKPASVISECNTTSESHTTTPSPLALLCSISLTPKLLNIKTSPLAYPSILQYIIIHPLLLLTTNYLSTPNQSSYLNLLLIIINHHPHGIPFHHKFLIIIIIPACHNLITYSMKTPI